MSRIRLVNCTMTFDDGETVLNGINLSVEDKEFLTLLGPSGCGKSTTLRIIGGFLTPTSGDVFFGDVRINDLPPYKRKINTVFQKYALFPHLNVFENVAFGLRIGASSVLLKEFNTTKLTEKSIEQLVADALALVGLSGFQKRRVGVLSGGQQQRVAIARAIINRPQVLLLDEPLGALDLKLRKEMQIELKALQKRVGITFIYVTHDQEEALTMSDTIVVMNRGNIQQIGSPTDIYNEPQNAFVADFIGESNIVPGVMIADKDVVFARHRWVCVDDGFDAMQRVDIVIRPEDIETKPTGKHFTELLGKLNKKDPPPLEAPSPPLLGVVRSVLFKGVHYEMVVESEDIRWIVHDTVCHPVGAVVTLSITPENIHVMDTPDLFADGAEKMSREELENNVQLTIDN